MSYFREKLIMRKSMEHRRAASLESYNKWLNKTNDKLK